MSSYFPKLPTEDLIPKNRRCRNQHSLAFQIPSANKEAYKSSFLPQTIWDWNDLPDSLISSAEMSDDCLSKFASLVRAVTNFPPGAPPLVKNCQFGVSPVNHSDSDSVDSVRADQLPPKGTHRLMYSLRDVQLPFRKSRVPNENRLKQYTIFTFSF